LWPLVARLGGSRVSDIEPTLLPSAEKLLAWLQSTVPPHVSHQATAWRRVIRAKAPTISDQAATRMGRMLETRTRLLEDRISIIKHGPRQGTRHSTVPPTLKAFQKKPAAKFLMATTDGPTYDAMIARHVPKAHARAGADARAAAEDYGRGEHRRLFNDPARAETITEDIKLLDSLIAANHEGAASDFRVIRYLKGKHTTEQWHQFDQQDVGTVIADKAYSSVSITEDFVWQASDTILLIDVRKGERRFTAPAAAGEPQHYKSEHEFIFGRNIPLLIKGVERRGSYTVLTCEMIPENVKVPQALIRYAWETVRTWFK